MIVINACLFLLLKKPDSKQTIQSTKMAKPVKSPELLERNRLEPLASRLALSVNHGRNNEAKPSITPVIVIALGSLNGFLIWFFPCNWLF